MLLLQIAQSIGTPRGNLPSFSELVTAGAPNWAVVLSFVGDLLWTVVYILAIRLGVKARTYAIPMVAIGLNVNWEVVHTIVHPPALFANLVANLIWLGFDLLIVLQLIRYGRGSQRIEPVRRFFAVVIVGTLAMALAGHITFYTHITANSIFPDKDGVVSAFVINLVMSILFVSMYFGRPDGEGLSKPIAWLKMLGTAAISFANVIAFETTPEVSYQVQIKRQGTAAWVDAGTIGNHTVHPGFLYFLFIAILIFDLVYLRLLYRERGLPV